MLDTSAIGAVIADAMLTLEGIFPECRVRTVALVVEVDDGQKPTTWYVHGDDRVWVNRVALEMGLEQLDVDEAGDTSDEEEPSDTSD